MKVLVQRDTGDNVAPDPLVDPLSIAYSACVAKGQSFLYDSFTKKMYDITMPFRGAYVCGSTIEVNDSSLGESFKSRLTAWSINLTVNAGSVTIEQTISIERSEI